MEYPGASAEQIGFFRERGYLAVPGAVPQTDLGTLVESCCDLLVCEVDASRAVVWISARK